MWRLYSFFMGWILRTVLISIPVLAFALLIFDKFDGHLETALGTLGPTFVLVAPVVAAMLLPKNLSWILPLPVSRRKIFAANAAINLSLAPLMLFAFVAISVLCLSVKFGISELSEKFWKILDYFTAESDPATIGTYAITVLMLEFYVAMCLSIYRFPLPAQAFRTVKAPGTKQGLKWFAILGSLALVVRLMLGNPFFAFGALTIGFAACLAYNLAFNLSLAAPAKKRTFAACVGLASFQVVAVYALALTWVHSENPTRVASATLFLGRLGGTLPEPQLRQLLLEPTASGQFADLSELYVSLYGRGKLLDERSSDGPNVQRLIASRSTTDALALTGSLYDFSSLGFPSARTFLARAHQVRGVDSVEYLAYKFLKNRWSGTDTQALLKSDNDLEVALGLLRSRYYREPTLIPLILSQMARYSDHEKLLGLATLSVLTGRKWKLEDLQKEKEYAKSPPKFFEVNCAEFSKVNSTRDKKLRSTAELNVCLREAALARLTTDQLRDLEWDYWYQVPLYTNQFRTFKKVF